MTEETKEIEKIEKGFEPEITIEPLAVPYRSILRISSSELREYLDKFWTQHGESIAKAVNYKGKKEKGGKLHLKEAQKFVEKNYGLVKIYAETLSELVNGFVTSEQKNKIMMITDIHVVDFDKEICSILSFFYFWSKIHFDQELDFCLTNPLNSTFETEMKKRIETLQRQYCIKSSLENGVEISDNYEVKLDLLASIDGNPYEEGTLRGVSVVVKNISNPVLKESVKQHKIGDLFELQYENPREGDLKGKIVSAVVKIHEGFSIEYHDPIENELYEVAGYESFEGFEKKFKEEFDNYMKNVRENAAFEHVINQIISKGVFDPIPQEWVRKNLELFIERHMKEYKGDKQKAYKALGVDSEEGLQRAFEGQIYKETINQMAIYAYANKFGIDSKIDKVVEDIMSKVAWKEKD